MATPKVPAGKQDGSIRICVDFKVTVDPVLEVEQYPLPLIGDQKTIEKLAEMFSCFGFLEHPPLGERYMRSSRHGSRRLCGRHRPYPASILWPQPMLVPFPTYKGALKHQGRVLEMVKMVKWTVLV